MRHLFFKTLMLSVFLIGIAFQGNSQVTNVSLVVTKIDGTEQTFQLDEESQLYFENGDQLVIKDVAGNTTSFGLDKIRKIVCSEVAGAQESTASQLQIFPNPTHNSFIVRNLTGTGLARIYSLDGRLVKLFQAYDGMSVDVSDLTNGMYLMNINGQTLKLMKL